MREYKEFKVGKLFEVKQGRRLKKDDQVNGNLPYIMSGSVNNGISNFISNPVVVEKNCLTGSILGDVFFHSYMFGYSDDVCFIKNESLIMNQYLYVAIAIKRSIGGKAVYGNKYRHDKYRNLSISLPITPDGQPDWDYMDAYIQALKGRYLDRVKTHTWEKLQTLAGVLGVELDSYLKGEIDVALPDLSLVSMGYFKVGELFEVKGTKSTDAKNVRFVNDSFDIEFVGRTEVNNGVQGYVNASDFDFDPNPAGDITISQVGTVMSQLRDKPYFTSQNITRLGSNYSKNVKLYIVSCINKYLFIKGYVGYNTIKQSDIKEMKLSLPITPDGKPDWNFMDRYIARGGGRVLQEAVANARQHQVLLEQIIERGKD